MTAALLKGNTPMTRDVDFSQDRKTLRYKPARITKPSQLDHEMRLIAGDRAGILRPSIKRRFVTFGSCFATNVANALKERNASVYTLCVTEDVNSTYNNRQLLRRVFLGETSGFIEELHTVTGVNFDEFLQEFKGATDIIFTLGNIYHMKDERGHVLRSRNCAGLSKETFEETQNYLREMIALLRQYTQARLFISVSPVPISGYRGDDFTSVMEADCASKCQLHTALRSLSGYTYIPTFEIFRWLAAHQEFATFGDGGNHPRHITKSHIEMAMGILCSE